MVKLSNLYGFNFNLRIAPSAPMTYYSPLTMESILMTEFGFSQDELIDFMDQELRIAGWSSSSDYC